MLDKTKKNGGQNKWNGGQKWEKWIKQNKMVDKNGKSG